MAHSLVVQMYPFADQPSHLITVLPAWRATCFPDGQAGIVWRRPEYALWLLVDGQPVSTLSIHDHSVLVGAELVHVGGIASVMTPPEHRRYGFASALLRHAVDVCSDEFGASFGLLGCEPHNVGFYARLGWQAIDAEFVYTQPNSDAILRFPWDDRPMVLPLCGATWPESNLIDFNGLPW